MTARVHASCTKQMVLLFVVSVHIIPMDITIDANYTMVVLDGELVYIESLTSRYSQSYVCVYISYSIGTVPDTASCIRG
jgi:hypothetical protein